MTTPNPQQTPPAEPTAPETAVSGGPGVGAPAAPELRAVRIGGREVQVPPDVAEAITAREREYEQGFNRQGAELGELRAQRREWETERERARAALQVQPQAPQGPDVDTLLFTKPKEALDHYKASIVNELRAEREQERRTDRERRQQEQNTAEFWNRFYADHPDFSRADDHWLVEATLQRNFPDLSGMSVAEGQKKLGDLTRQAVLSIIQKRAPQSSGSPRTVVEGASGRSERAAAPRAEEPAHASLSDVINARRRAKRSPARAAAS